MAKAYKLSATKRDRAGKGAARALRREKQTPAVIYGDNQPPVTITIPTKEANVEYNKAHMFTSICELELEGKTMKVLARDVQLHPVKDNVLHVDFLRVTDKTMITVAVPVHFINQDDCPGLLAKGTLNVVRYEVEINCQAVAIPDEIEVDMSKFDIGDAIKISHANMPAGSKPVIDDRDFNLAMINAPRLIVDDEPTEAPEAPEAPEATAEVSAEDKE